MTNGDRWSAYWRKSRENLEVSDIAQSKGKFNAAMSRYYYALRFAIGAVFLKRDLNDPIPKLHWELIEEAGSHLNRDKPDLDVWLKKAKSLRERGDYKEMPVMPQEFKNLVDELDSIFAVIRNEIYESR